MIFLASRANLDKRTLLTRIHNQLRTQVSKADSPVEQVWYHTSSGHKTGVRAAINAPTFLGAAYPIAVAELHVSFDFPSDYAYDFYTIQWVESERDLMLGWQQDETHMDLGECHLQLDYNGITLQRDEAAFLDAHPLNVFDQRTDQLMKLLESLTWDDDGPTVPAPVISSHG
jgi:hypothetical protein